MDVISLQYFFSFNLPVYGRLNINSAILMPFVLQIATLIRGSRNGRRPKGSRPKTKGHGILSHDHFNQ